MLLFLFAVLAGNALAGPGTKGSWVRVESEHFTLYSNADKERTASMATQLERLRDALIKIAPDLRLVAPRPSYIYVFRDTPTFRSYARGKTKTHDVGGLFFSRRDAHYVMVDAGSGLDPFNLVYHEYLHQVVDDTFPNAPLWVSEGMAEYFSTFWSNGFQAEIGAPIDTHVRDLQSKRMMSFDAVFEMGARSWGYQTPEWKTAFDAQSWALVHYLIHAGPRDRFIDSIGDLGPGKSSAEVIEELVSIPPSEIATLLRDYLAREEIPFMSLDLRNGPESIPIQVTRLQEEDALWALGRLVAQGDEKTVAKAEKHFSRALKLNPRHAPSHAALGDLRSRQGRHDDAETHFRRSLEIDADDYLTHYLYGRSVINRLQSRGVSAFERSPATLDDILEARESFRRSTQLSPRFAESWVGLGYTFLFEQPVPDAGIAVLERARDQLPARGDVVYYEVVALLQRGDHGRANALLGETLDCRPSVWIARAERAVVVESVRAARVLAVSGKTDEGVGLLKRAAEVVNDPELRAEVEKHRRALLARQD